MDLVPFCYDNLNNIQSNSTRNYYNDYANDYFLKTYRANITILWSKLSKQKVGNKFLDLGCGSGRDLLYFGERNLATIGIDISYNLVKCAKEFSHQPVIQADMYTLPFEKESFDVVWSIGTLLHIPREYIDLVLSEINRVLNKRSVFVASLKSGIGDTFDEFGRYFVYYGKNEWADKLAMNNFLVKSLEVIRETRGSEQIDWIVSVVTTK